MWIREIPKELQKKDSGIKELNFLYKERNIYVMDNHLAAGWCWLQELKPGDSYNFFHVDRHLDLLFNAPDINYRQLKDHPHISLDEYTSLEFNYSKCVHKYKVFQWDNYIKQINNLFPNWFNQCYFATHEWADDREPNKLNIVYRPNAFELYNNIYDWLQKDIGTKWIFNLDLDYFFNEKGMQLFSDDYIKAMMQNLKDGMEYIAVLTIALSPECCGGWNNAIRIMNIVAKELEIQMQL